MIDDDDIDLFCKQQSRAYAQHEAWQVRHYADQAALAREIVRIDAKRTLHLDGCDDLLCRAAIEALFDIDLDYAYQVLINHRDVGEALARLRQHM